MGGLISLSLHAAAGFALLWAWDQGAPVRDVSSGDRSSVMVVELIPSEPADGAARGNSSQNGETADTLPETRPPQPSGPSGALEPLPRAAGSPSASAQASVEAEGDARDISDLPRADVLSYRRRLEAHLARYRIYPAAAQDAGREGVVMLHFIMSHDGKVIEAWVGESSGETDIDREAVAAVMRAQPLPTFPQGWPGRLSVILPVTFRLG